LQQGHFLWVIWSVASPESERGGVLTLWVFQHLHTFPFSPAQACLVNVFAAANTVLHIHRHCYNLIQAQFLIWIIFSLLGGSTVLHLLEGLLWFVRTHFIGHISKTFGSLYELDRRRSPILPTCIVSSRLIKAVGLQACTTTLEICLAVPQKINMSLLTFRIYWTVHGSSEGKSFAFVWHYRITGQGHVRLHMLSQMRKSPFLGRRLIVTCRPL
jgi:hypothetical protein